MRPAGPVKMTSGILVDLKQGARLTVLPGARKYLIALYFFGTGNVPRRRGHWVATSSTGRGTKSKRHDAVAGCFCPGSPPEPARRALAGHQNGRSADDVMPKRSYFDWNATAPMRAEARQAFDAALLLLGNPSSV